MQVLDLTEVVALLKSTELPNTVEVQMKGASYELTIPEDFEAAWNIMEACRRQTQAMKLQQAAVCAAATWWMAIGVRAAGVC